jgi:hypothetical protein
MSRGLQEEDAKGGSGGPEEDARGGTGGLGEDMNRLLRLGVED